MRPYYTDSAAWVPKGRCAASGDPDAWHPDDETSTAHRTEHARHICRSCPAAEACLDYALRHPWVTGIWADTTTAQRRRIRRNQRRQAA
ncbi:WhiB family transcriptional regulator [Klebsiella pneumoniae]|nr:WhiB family transcriptional regulator [Klebsiella pneumoniae]